MKEKAGLNKMILALLTVGVVVCIALMVLFSAKMGGYYITIGKSAHGTVTADKKRADASETVTLTCTADKGYEVKEIYVNGEVSEETTFAMPEENVLVEVKFAMASAKKGETEAYEGDTPGAIAYKAIYPTGETHIVSWDFIYEKDGLAATAWVEGETTNGNGVLLNLSKEELDERGDFNYLPNNTYQIFCQYQKENDVISPKTTVKCADAEGIMQEKETGGIEVEIDDWKEDGKTVGYQAKIKVKYSLLGYNGKKEAMSSLVLLAGNRAEVLPNTIAEFWLDGEYDSENYLSYPRLVDDNTLQKNKFIDMTEMELEAYRDTGRVLDGEISNGEYRGTILEDASQDHRIKTQAHLTKGRNVQMVMEIESNTSFEEIVNAYPGVGQYLFAEIGLGNNDGQTCTMIKTNVMGEVENAITAVKLIEDNKNSDYKYKAVIEMWIPKASISNNTNANMVRLSRLALFSGNMGQGSKADNIFLVARWADINNCNITTNGIKLESEIVPPEAEVIGMDGILSDGEYKGATIQNQSKTHRVSVQGYLTEGKNIRLAIKVDANTAPDKIVNDFPSISKYLFVEAAFGDNTGENTEKSPVTLVKVNVLGQAAYAAAEVKTTDNGASAEYRYSTVIEMWIPQSSITNNTNPDRVEITRLAVFAENREGSKNSQNLFTIAKWAGLNECFLTADGIKTKEDIMEEEAQVQVPESEADGFDGVISAGEYQGEILESTTNNYKTTLQGYLTDEKNVRLALKIESNTKPETVVNKFGEAISQPFFAEFGFGENSGNGDCTLVKANILGKAVNAAVIAKTTDKGASAEYRYETVVEIWVPKASVTDNTNEDEVRISRLALFHDTKAVPDAGIDFVVAKWAGINDCRVTAAGIELDSTIKVPASESDGFDGIISAGEYQGMKIQGSSESYKVSVQGYLTEGKNIRLAMEIDAKTAPEIPVNSYEGLSRYLFAEFAFGNNDGTVASAFLKANVLGKAEGMATVVKSINNVVNVVYPYKTVIEMWIPKEAIHDNVDEDNVPITRMALFHETDVTDPGINWLVAKWADINNCSITAHGIWDSERQGMDGMIATDEYQGELLEGAGEDYRATVKGFLTAKKNARLVVQIDSKFNPEESHNDYPGVGSHLFAEFGFGENSGDGDCTLVKANVFGNAENAEGVAKTVDNGENAEYRYTTIIEMLVPSSAFTNNLIPEEVRISRIALFNKNVGTFVVANWTGTSLNPCHITEQGIAKSLAIPEAEKIDFDGVIQKNEYKGILLDSKASSTSEDYKMTVQGYVNAAQNLRLGVTVFSNVDPKAVVNPTENYSEYLYAEFCFGDNDGNTANIFADFRGKAKNAVTVVKTEQLGDDAAYKYKTVMEMWIPKGAVTSTANPNKVQFTRAALFHQNHAKPEGINETWLVHRSAWNGGGMHNCYVTTEGIVETHLVQLGIDGVIDVNEYGGEVPNSAAAGVDATHYYMESRAKLLSGDNLKIAVKIDSVESPETIVNSGKWSEYLYVELGLGLKYATDFGNNELIYADVLGNAKGATTVVKTTAYSGNNANYKYTTVIEMYVPNSSIANNTNSGQLVHFMRNYLWSGKLAGEVGAAMATYSNGGPYCWWYITPTGISHD